MNVYEHYNHAMACADSGCWDEAVKSLTTAHEMLPECPIIARYLSVGLLTKGRFREGLRLAERRFDHPILESPPLILAYIAGPRIRDFYKKPYWDGKESLVGKTIYVFNEGGFGDFIQSIRYLPQLKSKGAKVILEVKKEVYNLLSNYIAGVDELVMGQSISSMLFLPRNKPTKIDSADCVVSLLSLWYYFDPDLDNHECEFPYLFSKYIENEAVDMVRACDSKMKIGIVWAGKPGHGNDDRRSTIVGNFLPLKNIPGVQLFSLQKGEMGRMWKDKPVNLLEGIEALGVIDLGPKLNDFNDTANVLNQLDAVVCVDTSVAHLAGAMGVPVWTLLPERTWAEWRWQRRWYDSQKLMFQKTDGDWKGLLEEAANDISKTQI